MRSIFAPIIVAGMFIYSEITLGHGTESHASESQAIEQSPATNSAATLPSKEQSIQAP